MADLAIDDEDIGQVEVAISFGVFTEGDGNKAFPNEPFQSRFRVVVGGFTDPQGSRVGLGALLVGYYDAGDLVFAGKVGTGFDAKLLLDLRGRFGAMELPSPPFTKSKGLPKIRAHWVRPEIVVQVGFIEWTVHGKLRHPRLLGVRFDKDPREVMREQP